MFSFPIPPGVPGLPAGGPFDVSSSARSDASGGTFGNVGTFAPPALGVNVGGVSIGWPVIVGAFAAVAVLAYVIAKRGK